ncbi:hypothetical protein GOP47_0025934 [Adiantum capillus-veneris]|uniref:Uncharacterized protein n=1 Tax=Adiantum capillus-veneris TaxID=13818 RepID=A0A9D4U1E2_ADICA|nr:hypothetical protein GOP47_0025934 [Adiantum capillus-veneris]
MLSIEERKILMRVTRIEAVIIMSQSADDTLRKTNESDIHLRNFVEQIWENTIRHLRNGGNAEFCEREKLQDFDYRHRIRTILGSMYIAYTDLRDIAPAGADVRRLELWDTLWIEQKVKSKRMNAHDAETLAKRLRIAKNTAAASSS